MHPDAFLKLIWECWYLFIEFPRFNIMYKLNIISNNFFLEISYIIYSRIYIIKCKNFHISIIKNTQNFNFNYKYLIIVVLIYSSSKYKIGYIRYLIKWKYFFSWLSISNKSKLHINFGMIWENKYHYLNYIVNFF